MGQPFFENTIVIVVERLMWTVTAFWTYKKKVILIKIGKHGSVMNFVKTN